MRVELRDGYVAIAKTLTRDFVAALSRGERALMMVSER